MKRLSTFLAILIVTAGFFQLTTPLTSVSFADTTVCQQHNPDPSQTTSQLMTDTVLKDPTCAYNSLGSLIGLLITLVIFAGALTALFFIIFASIQWITAKSGDGAAKARATMIYAVAGLIGLAMIYVFMLFYNNLIPKL